MSWLGLALATALFYGLQGVWTKWITRRVSGPAASWAIFAFAFPTLAAYLALQGLPQSIDARFWPALLTNVTINLLSFYLYVSAIQKSDLSLTYPLLALTPVFVLPVEWALLGDLPGARGLGGSECLFATRVHRRARVESGRRGRHIRLRSSHAR